MKNWFAGLKFAGQRHNVTFATTGTIEVGDAVVLSAAGTVSRGAGAPVGIVETVEADGHAGVLVYGEIIETKVASALTPGYTTLACNANGELIDAGEDPGRPAIVFGSDAEHAAVTLL